MDETIQKEEKKETTTPSTTPQNVTQPTPPATPTSIYRKPEYQLQPPTQLTPPTPPQPVRRELTEEEKAFLDALGSVVSSAQELSYVLASIDPDLLQKYSDLRELFESARNVVRSVYRFHKLIKERSRGSTRGSS